nr:hypothetical protein [uncultured Clostridium sp.]
MILNLATPSDVIKVAIQGNSWGDSLAFYLSIFAFGVSMFTAWIQWWTYSQEWRPVLSYKGIESALIIAEDNSAYEINYNFIFENTGRCPIVFEMKKLNILLDGEPLEDVKDTSKGHSVGSGQIGRFNRFYVFQVNCPDPIIMTRMLPSTKFIFQVEYYKIANTKKRYKLDYEIDMTYNGAGPRGLFVKSDID